MMKKTLLVAGAIFLVLASAGLTGCAKRLVQSKPGTSSASTLTPDEAIKAI